MLAGVVGPNVCGHGTRWLVSTRVCESPSQGRRWHGRRVEGDDQEERCGVPGEEEDASNDVPGRRDVRWWSTPATYCPMFATKLAMSPSSVAHWVMPNTSVKTPVMASAAVSETGTRTGVLSPSGAGFIHISLAMLA